MADSLKLKAYSYQLTSPNTPLIVSTRIVNLKRYTGCIILKTTRKMNESAIITFELSLGDKPW
jgi:hypothetical protein